MAHSRNKPTASPPPTLGEGCLSRYDPEALSDEDGTDFADAAELWRQLNSPEAERDRDSGEHLAPEPG